MMIDNWETSKLTFIWCIGCLLSIASIVFTPTVYAQPNANIVCSYAPSQSNMVAAISGAAGGASATVGAVAAATGLTVVAHSSGAMILTGTSGYIAGTIGVASIAPVIVVVGIVVGGTAVTLELLCANKNHKDQVQKVQAAAGEFSRRFNVAMKKTIVAAGVMRKSITPVVDRAAVETKHIAVNVWQYANRASITVSTVFSKNQIDEVAH